jgi:hypothetical protein
MDTAPTLTTDTEQDVVFPYLEKTLVEHIGVAVRRFGSMPTPVRCRGRCPG